MSDFEWQDAASASTLSIGPWYARATSGDWSVFLDGVGAVRSGMRASRADNKAAIIAAFAELRVVAPSASADSEATR